LDGLGYLSIDGMVSATGLPKSNFCLACFDGQYPVQPDLAFTKNCLEG
jgi:amidophosphoribosyltransferase